MSLSLSFFLGGGGTGYVAGASLKWSSGLAGVTLADVGRFRQSSVSANLHILSGFDQTSLPIFVVWISDGELHAPWELFLLLCVLPPRDNV